MNLLEVAASLNTTIEVFRTESAVSASLAKCFVHVKGSFVSAIGTGRTVHEAMRDLARQISGRKVCNKQGAVLLSLGGFWITCDEQVDLHTLDAPRAAFHLRQDATKCTP